MCEVAFHPSLFGISGSDLGKKAVVVEIPVNTQNELRHNWLIEVTCKFA